MAHNTRTKEYRYKLIHTMSGQTVAKANSLEELREIIDPANVNYFTLHDLKLSRFSGASVIFKTPPKHNN